jgi:hypothetical protein
MRYPKKVIKFAQRLAAKHMIGYQSMMSVDGKAYRIFDVIKEAQRK